MAYGIICATTVFIINHECQCSAESKWWHQNHNCHKNCLTTTDFNLWQSFDSAWNFYERKRSFSNQTSPNKRHQLIKPFYFQTYQAFWDVYLALESLFLVASFSIQVLNLISKRSTSSLNIKLFIVFALMIEAHLDFKRVVESKF